MKSLSEIEEFERRDAILSSLLEKRRDLEAASGNAGRDLAALERKKVAALAEGFDEKKLGEIGSAIMTARAEVKRLESLRADIEASLKVAKHHVVAAEGHARRALLTFCREREAEAMGAVQNSAREALLPWAALYWARRGMHGTYSVHGVLSDIGTELRALINELGPGHPIERPESASINDTERALIRPAMQQREEPPEAA